MKRINNYTKKVIESFIKEIGEEIKKELSPRGRGYHNLMISDPISFRYLLLDILSLYGEENKYKLFSKEENKYYGAKELEQYLFGDVQANELYRFK